MPTATLLPRAIRYKETRLHFRCGKMGEEEAKAVTAVTVTVSINQVVLLWKMLNQRSHLALMDDTNIIFFSFCASLLLQLRSPVPNYTLLSLILKALPRRSLF